MTTLAQKISEAETALHDLVLGNKPSVFVDQNGERIEYTRTSAKSLERYISVLKSQQTDAPKGPMKVIF